MTRPTFPHEMIPALLAFSALSREDLAKAIGRSFQTISPVVKQLHLSGHIHIVGWREPRTPGPKIALFTWGPGVDVPRPARMSPEERVARYRATPKGKATLARAQAKYARSTEGRIYKSSHAKARWAREKFASGGVAAIDPLLATLLGQKGAIK